MCVCKCSEFIRAVNSLFALCKKQEVDLGNIKDYDSFFVSFTSNCPKSETTYTGCDCEDKKNCNCPKKHTTYISWDCAKDPKKTCIHIQDKWEELKSTTLPNSKPDSTVPLTTFLKNLTGQRKKKTYFALKLRQHKLT